MTPTSPQALAAAIRAGDPSAVGQAPRLAAMLARYRISQWNGRFAEDVVLCLETPGVDGQILARTASALLLAREPDAPDRAALARIGVDPLWRAFLGHCINLDPLMERRLGALAELLAGGVEADGVLSDDLIDAACALALQAEANEHVAASPERLVEARPRLKDPLHAWVIGVLGGESGELPVSERRRLEDVAAGHGALLAQRLIDEPARERALAVALPRLRSGGAANDVSSAVRDQYEASPYPRWRAAPTSEPRLLSDVVAVLPGDGDVGQVRDLLIAGCGTGFEAADLARMDPTLRITALDLSARSLAYAARRCEELGVSSVTFVQGDILDLPGWGMTFDAAISTGVLHHMERPEDGVRAIASVLRPGGVLRMAVYSRRARAAVRAAHQRIASLGLSATPEDIRAFRQEILDAGPDGPLADLLTSDDFYSLSGARDLLFHVHEHAYDPVQTGALLAEAGLSVIGVDVPPEGRAALEAFGADPLDLQAWDRVESQHPGLFAGMIALWGRKSGDNQISRARS